MQQWQIGAVTVSALVESSLAIEPGLLLVGVGPGELLQIPWLRPCYIDERGALKLVYQAFLVEAPGLRLVVDTCVGNDKERPGFAPHSHLSTPFLAHMAVAGFGREQVDVVICTHMHYDHVGWNTLREGDRWVPTFPNAQYLFARTEYEHWQGEGGHAAMDQPQVMADSIRPVFEAGLARLVETDHRIAPEVRLLPTPGHTPGHVSVLIESQGAAALITGDAIITPGQIARPEWVSPHEVDPAQVVATRRRILDLCCDDGRLLIGNHFAEPAGGHVRRDGGGYRFEGAARSL